MRKLLFLLIALFLVAACATSQPEPTSTPSPPTEPPAPTDTSTPPTDTPTPPPNPHAEEVLLAVAEAMTTQDYTKARTFFSEDITTEFDSEAWGAKDFNAWFTEAARFGESYEFNEFVVAADEVEFKWFVNVPWVGTDQSDNYKCYAYATMEEDKILTLRVIGCAKI